MSTWIALFRGINVGGNNILPMKELVRELETVGLEDVRSYIQSGNVVFRSRIKTPRNLATRIAAQIESSHGFSPRVLILSAEQLEQAIAANPFPEAATEPKSLHLFFLESTPASPNLAALASLCTKTERFHHSGTVFYLHAPDGDLDLIIAQGDHRMRRAAGGFRVFENNAQRAGLHSIQFTLKGGPESNAEAFGARVRVYAGERQWIRDHWPTQCNGSTMPLPLHFGLASETSIDSVAVIRPDGRRQVARDLPAEGQWLWREEGSPVRISR